MKQWMWFSGGLCAGLVSLTIAVGSVPSGSQGTSLSDSLSDDTVLYQDLSEIRVRRRKMPDFDGDIAALEAREKRYRERLPLTAARGKSSSVRRKRPASQTRRVSRPAVRGSRR